MNLLLFAKLVDEYYIICNTRVHDAIYVQSKDDGKYLQFQRDPKFNLYYIDISKANVEDHCFFQYCEEINIFHTRSKESQSS